jgi:membrane protein DedA with SNARE-associated domain
MFAELAQTIAMFFATISDYAIAWVKVNEAWAPFIVALLAFCESVAILSLIIPATVILVGVGALIGASGIEFFPIWFGAVLGACLGDWLSFWFGGRFKTAMYRIYPLSKHPEIITKGEAFFHKYGPWSVFIGRFFGPLRAVIPLVAGIFGMRRLYFQMANISSGMVWAFVLLAPGAALLSS